MINDNYEFKTFLYDIFQLIISLKSTRNNVKYLITALKETIKKIDIKDGYLTDLINGINIFFNFSKALSKLNIELKSKVLVDEIYILFEEKMDNNKNIRKDEIKELDKMFLEFKKAVKEAGIKEIKPKLISEGFYTAVKTINFDNISLYLRIPKYKSGLSLIFKFAGLTEFVSQNLF